MIYRKHWCFILVVAALTQGILVVKGEGSSPGTLMRCDSSQIRRYADLFFGTGPTDGWSYMVVGSSFRKIVTNPEHEKALILYGGRNHSYVDPSFYYCDLYDDRLQDSIRIVVYDVVDFETFLSPDLTSSWVKEEYANVVRDRGDTTVLVTTIPLCKGSVSFPSE